MSFTEFLNSYRLDAALALLTETDKDITEIALESGFQSIRSFNEYFKSRIGTTPVKYRTGSAAR
jgi:xylan 1,4-beta-xylosidase